MFPSMQIKTAGPRWLISLCLGALAPAACGDAPEMSGPAPTTGSTNSSCVTTATGVRCNGQSSGGASGGATGGSSGGPSQPSPPPPPSEAPSWLFQTWINPAGKAATTYRFDYTPIGTVRPAQVRSWFWSGGSIGWASKVYSENLIPRANGFELSSPLDGKRHRFTVVSRTATSMTVDDPTGSRMVWFTCAAKGWPPVIHATVCRGS